MAINFFHHPDFTNANGPTGYERAPQQPVEGQPVILAAAAEGARDLFAIVEVDGIYQPDIAGKFDREESGRRFYMFELGCFPYGSRVNYSFETCGQRSRPYGFDVAKETVIGRFSGLSGENGCLCVEIDAPLPIRLFASFVDGSLILSQECRAGSGILKAEGTTYRYSDATGCSVEIEHQQGCFNVYSKDGRPLMKNLRLAIRHTAHGMVGFTYHYDTGCTAVYGLGERFSGINHTGQALGCMVVDHYTNQRKSTYFPLPFYYGDDGHGVFINTPCQSEFDFGSIIPGRFSFGARVGVKDTLPDIHVLFGEPKEILQRFSVRTGRPGLPPKWAFGLWISANRWNRQAHIEEQLTEAQALGYPADAVVIEAWSDEATFYIWNGAEYTVKGGAERFSQGDFQYRAGGRWPDPSAMIRQLHERGMKLVLWQIPVLKHLGNNEPANAQHAEDIRHAVECGYCAGDGAGGVYSVPNFWFGGSKLPDFTRRDVRDWWFAKRRHLIDMGVDGFKTDGGEFIYEDDCTFSDDTTGIEMKNAYVESYLDAYGAFAGLNRPLFSRAGYIGSQRHPLHWAGDQQSTWREMKSVLNAGLSLGMSGAPFWSFDIAGFAGPLPTAELYIRSTELAAFAPAMQWHSDYMHVQPDFTLYGPTGYNDRSPWNIARATGDPSVLPVSLYYAWLHANLLPQLYSEAQKSAMTGLPMIRHLALEYPNDADVRSIADEFMLGDLLVAPVVEEGARSRDVYLPEGLWMDGWTGEDIEGGRTVQAEAQLGVIPLYLKHGGAVALAMGPEMMPGQPFDKTNPILCFLTSGNEGRTELYDEKQAKHSISWDGTEIRNDDKEENVILLDKNSFAKSIKTI